MANESHLNGQLFEGSIKGGTPQLFPSAPYLTGKAKHPRGFTPERLRAVQETTKLDPQWHGDEGAAEVAAVRDNLARSTAPVAHMYDVGWRTDSRRLSGDVAAGEYQPFEHQVHSATIHLAPGQGRGLTPLHELGHHVSHAVVGTQHAAYDDPVAQGREEAYAENYAETHFRDRRRLRPVSGTAIDPANWTQEGQRGGRHGGFHEGWEQERANSPVLLKQSVQRVRALVAARHERIAAQQTLW